MSSVLVRRLSTVAQIVLTLLGSFCTTCAQAQEKQESAKPEAVVTHLKAEIPRLLAEHDVPELHFYTLNKSHATRSILAALR